jgi:DNA-binding MarR family transcriptional regulator
MSNHLSEPEIVSRVAAKIPALQDATTELDNAAAAALGVNLTDLHCLAILMRRQPAAASDLAAELRLTRGAMTAVLDRLARAKLAERRGDPDDRRGVLAVVTAAAKRRVQEIWSPIEEEGMAILSGYSQSDLRVIEDFLDRARSLQVEHAKRICALRKARSPKKPAGRSD